MYTQGSPPLKRHRLATALRPVMAAHALGDVESWPVGGRERKSLPMFSAPSCTLLWSCVFSVDSVVKETWLS